MATKPVANLSKARLDRIKPAMSALVERGELAGYASLIARRGEVHVDAVGLQDLETGVPMQRDTIFRIASMTKPIVAVAALMLVEEAKIRLDDSVERWLPELADRQVLVSLDGPITETVPAERSISLRDLLTFRLGFGAIMAPPGKYPIQSAVVDAGFVPSPFPSTFAPDEWMKRIGTLPLMSQPGAQWLYHTGSDILGVLIQRVAGQPLADFLKSRIFDPLGMKDSGFQVPEESVDRLASAYRLSPEGNLTLLDPGQGGVWSRPPAFTSGGGGMCSTLDDYLTFAQMLLDHGRARSERLLTRPTVELMLIDQITPEQKAASPFAPGFWESYGWGLGISMSTKRTSLSNKPGVFGWDGGFGTSWRSDPTEDMTCIILTQRAMRTPNDSLVYEDFRTLSYQAIDD